MLWIKALHIIALTLWFSGLFYLPRVFVYHASSHDRNMDERFLQMEKNLYYFIMQPGAGLTLLFGTVLLFNHEAYLHAAWLQIKLGLVFLLLLYHCYLGHLRQAFLFHRNSHSTLFYRWLNEISIFFLTGIVLLAVIKPLVY